MTWTLSSSRRPGTKIERSAANLLTLQAGDEGNEIVGVGANIAEASGGAAARRVGAPFRLLLAGALKRLSQPVLRIFHLHQTHFAELAGSDHIAGLPDHRITGVVAGEQVLRRSAAGFVLDVKVRSLARRAPKLRRYLD